MTELQIAELEIRGLTNSLAITKAELAATTSVFSTLAEKYNLLLAHVKAGGSDVVVVEKTGSSYHPTPIDYRARGKAFDQSKLGPDTLQAQRFYQSRNEAGGTSGTEDRGHGKDDDVVVQESETSGGVAKGFGRREGSGGSEGLFIYETRVKEAVKLAEELLYLLTH